MVKAQGLNSFFKADTVAYIKREHINTKGETKKHYRHYRPSPNITASCHRVESLKACNLQAPIYNKKSCTHTHPFSFNKADKKKSKKKLM